MKTTDAARAYPLARLTSPRLTLANWRAYVLALSRARTGGMLAAFSPRLVICGLAPWWIRPTPESGRVLWAGPLIAVEPGRPGRVHEALTAALSEIARRSRCDEVLVVQAGADPGSPMPMLGFDFYGSIVKRRPLPAVGDAT